MHKILLNQKSLLSNFDYLQDLDKNISIFPNLKSNAYGHDIYRVANILSKYRKIKYFCVHSVEEARQILSLNLIYTKPFITGFVTKDKLAEDLNGCAFAVWSVEQIKVIKDSLNNFNLHLFVDTGMSREGIRLDELKTFFINLQKFDFKIEFEGIMSHFSSADDLSSVKTKNQIVNFENSISLALEYNFNFKYKHISASAGTLINDNWEYNAARVGLALYGIDPIQSNNKLKPVLSLYSKLIQIKKIKKGDKIGYNEKFVADKDMTIGILPIGYNDGLDRRLSNIGYVKYKNKFCKFVGRISMNISTIDISSIKEPIIGDEIQIFSDEIDDLNSIEKASSLAEMIPYNLLTGIKSEIPRNIV